MCISFLLLFHAMFSRRASYCAENIVRRRRVLKFPPSQPANAINKTELIQRPVSIRCVLFVHLYLFSTQIDILLFFRLFLFHYFWDEAHRRELELPLTHQLALTKDSLNIGQKGNESEMKCITNILTLFYIVHIVLVLWLSISVTQLKNKALEIVCQVSRGLQNSEP